MGVSGIRGVRVVRLARQVLLLQHQPLKVAVDLGSFTAVVAVIAIIEAIAAVHQLLL